MHCRSCSMWLASLLSAKKNHLAKPLQGGGRVSLDGQHPAVSVHQQLHPLAVVPHILQWHGGTGQKKVANRRVAPASLERLT